MAVARQIKVSRERRVSSDYNLGITYGVRRIGSVRWSPGQEAGFRDLTD